MFIDLFLDSIFDFTLFFPPMSALFQRPEVLRESHNVNLPVESDKGRIVKRHNVINLDKD